jgi:hypothetical protein
LPAGEGLFRLKSRGDHVDAVSLLLLFVITPAAAAGGVMAMLYAAFRR